MPNFMLKTTKYIGRIISSIEKLSKYDILKTVVYTNYMSLEVRNSIKGKDRIIFEPTIVENSTN
jgi:hypothetical protein